jgi:hypothetical protein
MLTCGREQCSPHGQQNLLKCFTVSDEIERNEKRMVMLKTKGVVWLEEREHGRKKKPNVK